MSLADIQKQEVTRIPGNNYNLRILEVEYKATAKDPEKYMFVLDLETSSNAEVPCGVDEQSGEQLTMDPNDKKMKNWVVLSPNNPDLLKFAKICERAGVDFSGVDATASPEKINEQIIDILAQNQEAVIAALKGELICANVRCEERILLDEATGDPQVNPDTGQPMISYRYNVGELFENTRQWA